jgi:hypothetical protein
MCVVWTDADDVGLLSRIVALAADVLTADIAAAELIIPITHAMTMRDLDIRPAADH